MFNNLRDPPKNRIGMIDRSLPGFPGGFLVQEILNYLGHPKPSTRPPTKVPINPVFEVGTRFSSSIVVDCLQLDDLLDKNEEAKAFLSKKREENKHLVGLPFYKERTRFCTSTNTSTNTCDCSANKQACNYEFRCKICFDKFKNHQKTNTNAEYKCDCIYYTHDYQSMDVYVDHFVYYCRNPKIPPKERKHEDNLRYQRDRQLFEYYLMSVPDPETCRQAAISFIQLFTKSYAEHGFYAFEMLFGKYEKGTNFYPLDRQEWALSW
jgi:hypothetical protein